MGFKEFLVSLNEEIKQAGDYARYCETHANDIKSVEEYKQNIEKWQRGVLKQRVVIARLNKLMSKKEVYSPAYEALKDAPFKSARDLYFKNYRHYADSILMKVKNRPENKKNEELKFLDVNNAKTIEQVDEIINKYCNEPALKKEFEDKLEAKKSELVAGFLSRNPLEALELFKNELDERELDKIQEEVAMEDITLHPYFAPSKPLDKEINELISGSDDTEFNQLLEYINNEVIRTQKPELMEMYIYYGDRASDAITENANKDLVEEYKNKPDTDKTKNLFDFGPSGQLIHSEDMKKMPTKDIVQGYQDLKFNLSDETKAILKENLQLLDSLTNLDGTPFIVANMPVETDHKEYGFMPLISDRTSLSDAIKELHELKQTNPESEKIEELKNKIINITNHYKQTDAIMHKLMDNVQKFKMDDYVPGNISTSRNSFAPTYVMKNPMTNAKVNGIYQFMSLVKTSGLSIDEFLNDIDKGVHTYFKKYMNNKLFNESFTTFHSEREGTHPLLEIMEFGYSKMSSFGSEIAKRGAELNPLRQTAILQMIESDKERNKQNREKIEFIIHGYGQRAQDKLNFLANHFFDRDNLENENNKETIKNLFSAFHDEKVNKASLTVNVDVVDPYTAKPMKHFDRNAYLKNESTDYQKIVDHINLFKNKDGLTRKEDQFTLNALKDLASEMLIARNCEKEPFYQELLDFSGKKLNEIYEQKALEHQEPLSQFIENSFNQELGDYLGKNNIEPLMNRLSVLNEKYYSRFFLVRWFSPTARKEANAIDAMKKSLTDFGLPKNRLENVLKNVETIASLKQDYIDGKIKTHNIDRETEESIDDEFDREKTKLDIEEAKVNTEPSLDNKAINKNNTLNHDLNKNAQKK